MKVSVAPYHCGLPRICFSVWVVYALNRGIMHEDIGPFQGISRIENISKNMHLMHLIFMPGMELPWKSTTILYNYYTYK